MLKIIILLALVLSFSCKKRKVNVVDLLGENAPDEIAQISIAPAKGEPVDTEEFRIKKLTWMEDGIVATYDSLADLPLPQFCMAPAEMVKFTRFIRFVTKNGYKEAYEMKMKPKQFNKLVDDMLSDKKIKEAMKVMLAR